MEKLITDDPKTNAEALLNFAFMGKDRRVKLRNVEGQDEIDLCEYIVAGCCEYDVPLSADDIMDGAVMECACERAYLYYAAVQAAELRERLRKYEEAEREAENPKPLTLDELRQMDGKPVWIEDMALHHAGWELSEDSADYFDGRPGEEYGLTWVAYRHAPKEAKQ